MAERNLRIVTAVLVLAVGLIHLQEWVNFMRDVPKIGPLFVLNVAASVVVAALLFVRRGWLGIVGAIALSLGTLGGFLVARYGSVLGYSEPRWRTTAVLLGRRRGGGHGDRRGDVRSTEAQPITSPTPTTAPTPASTRLRLACFVPGRSVHGHAATTPPDPHDERNRLRNARQVRSTLRCDYDHLPDPTDTSNNNAGDDNRWPQASPALPSYATSTA